MGHSIHPIPGWDSCILSQDGISHTSHPRMGFLHPIPGWDIPYQAKMRRGQDKQPQKKRKKNAFKIPSHPRMGYPIFPSQPRMGNIISMPRWDIPYIPSQDGIIASHPRMGYISHIPHPRKGFLHPIPGRDIPSHDPRKG